MFEAVSMGAEMDRAEYDEKLPKLRQGLLRAQADVRTRGLQVFVVFAGVDKAGAGDVVNLLNEWMDPRFISTLAYDDQPSDEDAALPRWWRIWQDMPGAGRFALVLGGWYRPALNDAKNPRAVLAENERFERLLADNGALVLKFWMHLDAERHRARLEELSAEPETAWRVTERDWEQLARHDAYLTQAADAIARTDAPHAPWVLIDGADRRHRTIAVGEALLASLKSRLATDRVAPAPAVTPVPKGNVLDSLDLTRRKLPKAPYKTELARLQGCVARLQREAFSRGVSTVAAFEGWDAAGKGGAIRRVTRAMDARAVRVVPIAAPTDEELARNYLWRFWRRLPREGRVTVFDRSWYGRVLVERVEGFATDADWHRAYREINDFEAQLTDHGVVLLKFWLHLSPEEQKRRFKAREKTPWKRWKLTREDWRNREKWGAYAEAVHEMVARTSTPRAPWTLVSAEDKRSARLTVLRVWAETLEAAL